MNKQQKERKDTRVHLVAELKKLKQTPEIVNMISEAEAGEFHDYKNKKYLCGKLKAYQKLSQLGYQNLANRIANGEFDESADEQDKLNMRKDLPKQLWSILGL